MRRRPLVHCLVGVLIAGMTAAASAQPDATGQGAAAELPALTAGQVFALADAALQAGDTATAEAAYRALANDRDLAVRSEARFRLAVVSKRLGRYANAEVLLREILEEEPRAVRTRLERARVLDLMGDSSGAIRELRAARALGLPPEALPHVESFAAALRSRERFGFSFSLAVAPDTNINRATHSDRIETVIGDFDLDEDARERSGMGVAGAAQAHARVRFDDRWSLLGRTFANGDFYRERRFNDATLGVAVGPEIRIANDAVALQVSKTWREYGGARYSEVATLTLSDVHPLDRQTRLRASATLGWIEHAKNALQDGRSHSFGLSYERDLSWSRTVGVWLLHDRQKLRDPGYSTTFNEVGVYASQRFGWSKLLGTLSYGHLVGDRRLSIYPSKRKEDLLQASLAITLPRLEIAGFVPYVSVRATRNQSRIDLYDFDRVRIEFALTRAI